MDENQIPNSESPETSANSEEKHDTPTTEHFEHLVNSSRKGNGKVYLIAALIGCLPWVLLGILVVVLISCAVSGGDKDYGTPKVGIVRVSGTITGGKGGGDLFNSGAGAERIISELEKARKSDSIKAVVIRINSPGGSAAGSEEVYNEILKVRASGKPVIASMADIAASGGYYIASGSNEIMSDAATLTGSIGVIMEMEDLQKLFGKIGVGMNVIKSGKHKDIGSPMRPMTADEHHLLQLMVNDTYQQFLDAVAKGRAGKLTYTQLKQLADGRVFTGRQALKLKLVDKIGGLQDSINLAGKLAGIKGEPRTVELGKGSWRDIFDSDSNDDSTAYARKLLMDPNIRHIFQQMN